MVPTPVDSVSTDQAILDACDTLMARFGFRKMTMDDVAREAGISRRTIYHHFANKEDLGLRSIGRVVEQVHADMELYASSQETAVRRLEDVLAVRVIGRLDRVRAYARSLDELFEAVRPQYLLQRSRYFAREKELLTGVIESGIKSGEFRHCKAPEVADSMLLATNAFIPYSLSPDEMGSPVEVGTRLAAMVDLLVAAIIAPREDRDKK